MHPSQVATSGLVLQEDSFACLCFVLENFILFFPVYISG